MRIAVCIKQVPASETKIALNADKSGVDFNGVKWIINPYDEHAIEESTKLKSANPGSSVTVFSLGPKGRVVEALRTALAMGIDEAVVIDAPDQIDNSLCAKALAAAINGSGSYDLVLTGKLAIDDNAASVSQMIAAELKISHSTVVSKLSFSGNLITVERESESGTKEILEMTLPALVAANKGLNIPKYPSLPGIMSAKKKVIKEIDLASLDIDSSKIKIRYTDFQLPPAKPEVKMLSGDATSQAKEVVRLLREQAKVI